MARYLLYDGGCSRCAALAREVEARSEGRLQVRSLREPEIQALLDRVRPGWRWEPMLLEAEGEQVRVYTGLAMRLRLVQVLGPVRALRVAQAVARFGGPVLNRAGWTRRTVLQTLSFLPLVVFWKHRWEPPLAQVHAEGEEFAGFLLLPPFASMPSFIRPTLTPIFCEAEEFEANVWGARQLVFSDAKALQKSLSFPLYWPRSLANKSHQAYLITFKGSDKIFLAGLEWKIEEGYVRIHGQVHYPYPCPIYPVFSWTSPDFPIFPEKILTSLGPGVMLPTAQGWAIYWIANGILYTLWSEHDMRKEIALDLVQSLERVS